MKTILFLSLILLTSCMKETTKINIFHYNIKELDSLKLRDSSNKQLAAVKEIVSKFEFDIFSVNEIQYDLPMIPNKSLTSTGQNIKLLAKSLGLENFSAIFYPANTGMKASRDPHGNYVESFKATGARKYADPVNFGLYPGQYSTAALIKSDIKILDSKNIQTIKWKDFNPSIDLKKYTDGNGAPLPESTKLFDKNFTDILAEKNGFKFHIILLHTVPAFHFGNKKSPNYERNADQLRFLEWYLTQETSFKVEGIEIDPLPKDTPYIAIGDWNTELTNKTNPGSAVLRSLKEKSQFWMKEPLTISNEGPSFTPKRLQLQLDYITVSNHFNILESGVYRPNEERKELGCDKVSSGENIRSYTIKDSGKTCFASFNKDFLNSKQASDHFPIWAKLEVK
ncbi:endonuclease/exonuclease/phosphatase family protein [Halobacteriovorax sp.]|uniref:endonuclease/exonuclease/phosphatase family protein n=1 Tax=Halobacteriovorax sp. TaxID=2020862 RepID=UPI0035693AD0